MKSIVLLALLICFVSCAVRAQYRHKTEAEIAAMTPAQRVDDYANEQAYHKYDVSDEHGDLIEKYIWLDGVKALPRIIEIIDEYDPTRRSGKKGRKGERFDGVWMLLSDLDNNVFRLRSFKEGRNAIDALEHAVERMRKAGYGQPDQDDWARHGRFNLAVTVLEATKGVNAKDKDIRSTIRFIYNIILSDTELSEFSQFLAVHYSDYPSWSKGELTKDESQISGGYPVQIIVLKKPEPYYEAYQEFKKTK